MKFRFIDENDFDSYYEVKVRVDVARKPYNPNMKDKKKATIARDRARAAKLARYR